MTKLTKLQKLYNQRATFENAIHLTFELLPYAMNKEEPEMDVLNTIFSRWNSVKWYKDYDHWERSPDWSAPRVDPLHEYEKQQKEFGWQIANDARSSWDQIKGGFAQIQLNKLQHEIEEMRQKNELLKRENDEVVHDNEKLSKQNNTLMNDVERLRNLIDALKEPQP